MEKGMERKRPVKIWGVGELREARDLAVRACVGREDGALLIRVKGTADKSGGKYDYLFHAWIEAYSGEEKIFSKNGMVSGEELDEVLLLKGTAPFGAMSEIDKALGPGAELRIEMQKPLVERLVHAEKLERKLDRAKGARERRELGREFDAHWKRVLEMSTDPDSYRIYLMGGEDGGGKRRELLRKNFLPSLTAQKAGGRKRRLRA